MTGINGLTGRFESTTNGWSGINVKTGAGGTSYLLLDDGTNSATVEHWNNIMNFEIPDNTSRMTISGITGNVGIGVFYPTAKLEVAGTLKITDGTQGANKVLTSDANGLASWQDAASVETDPQVSSNTTNKVPKWNGTTLADGSIIDNGNVGIGITNPQTTLEVSSNGNEWYDGGIAFSDGSNRCFMYKDLSHSFHIGFNGVKRLTLASGGNVGIGTSTPGKKLDVNGQTRIKDHFIFNSSDGVINWGTADLYFRTNSTNGDETSYSDKMVIKNNGKVGIGITNPTSNLDVRTADNGLTIQSVSSSGSDTPLLVRSNNGATECMIIRANGRMGLGLTGPNGQFELSLDEGRKPSTNTWTITSDERLKTIDGNYTKGLAEIISLQPIVYYYKNVGNRTFDPRVLATQHVGFSAQAVRQIFPEAIGTDEDGYLNFNMHSILVAQINSIKELDAMNKNQGDQINELRAQIDALTLLVLQNQGK